VLPGDDLSPLQSFSAEEASNVADFLLRNKFLLSALELHQELLEAGGGAHSVGSLNEVFASQRTLERLVDAAEKSDPTHEETSAGPTAVSSIVSPFASDGLVDVLEERSQRISLLEYRLRGAEQDKTRLQRQMKEAMETANKARSAQAKLQEALEDAKAGSTAVPSAEAQTQGEAGAQQAQDAHSDGEEMGPADTAYLHALIRDYLKQQGFGMTSVTFEGELGEKGQSAASSGVADAARGSVTLTKLYQQQVRPLATLHKQAQDGAAALEQLAAAREAIARLEQAAEEHATAHRHLSEKNKALQEKLAAAATAPSSARAAPQHGAVHRSKDSARGEEAFVALSAWGIDEGSVDNTVLLRTLVGALPSISRALGSKQRMSLAPVLAACVMTHTNADARRDLLSTLLSLSKHPSPLERRELVGHVRRIAGHLSSAASHVAPPDSDEGGDAPPQVPTSERVASEMLPVMQGLAAAGAAERRALAALSAGALSPFLSQRGLDSAVATLTLLVEDEVPIVRTAVAHGAAAVAKTLAQRAGSGASGALSPAVGRSKGGHFDGTARRQFADVEELMWRLLLTPDREKAPSALLAAAAKRCEKHGLSAASEAAAALPLLLQGGVSQDDLSSMNPLTTVPTDDATSSWAVTVMVLLPAVVQWAQACGVLWSRLLPQALDMAISADEMDGEAWGDDDDAGSTGSRDGRSSAGGTDRRRSGSVDGGSSRFSGTQGRNTSAIVTRSCTAATASRAELMAAALCHVMPLLRLLLLQEGYCVWQVGAQQAESTDGDESTRPSKLSVTQFRVVDTSAALPSDAGEAGGQAQESQEHDALWETFVALDSVLAHTAVIQQRRDAAAEEWQVCAPHEVRVAWTGLQWFLRQGIPELLQAAAGTSGNSTVGSRTLTAYSSILRSICLTFGRGMTGFVVFPLVCKALGLPWLPAEERLLQPHALFGKVPVVGLICLGEEDETNAPGRPGRSDEGGAAIRALLLEGVEAPSDAPPGATDTDDVLAALHLHSTTADGAVAGEKEGTVVMEPDVAYRWVAFVPELAWLTPAAAPALTGSSVPPSPSMGASAAAQAQLGATGAALAAGLLPILGGAVLSVPVLPKACLSHALRQLLSYIGKGKAGWGNRHVPALEAALLQCGAAGGTTVVAPLLSQLTRVSMSEAATVRRCVARVLRGIVAGVPPTLLRSSLLPLLIRLVEDKDDEVATAGAGAVTATYAAVSADGWTAPVLPGTDEGSELTARDAVLKSLNAEVKARVERGPKEVIVALLRGLMRAVPTAAASVRDGAILDRLLELSSRVVAASTAGREAASEMMSTLGDTGAGGDAALQEATQQAAKQAQLAAVQGAEPWRGAVPGDLEEVAITLCECFRAYTSVWRLLPGDTQELLRQSVGSLLADDWLLDSDYRDLMRTSMSVALEDAPQAGVRVDTGAAASAGGSSSGGTPGPSSSRAQHATGAFAGAQGDTAGKQHPLQEAEHESDGEESDASSGHSMGAGQGDSLAHGRPAGQLPHVTPALPTEAHEQQGPGGKSGVWGRFRNKFKKQK